MSADSDRPGDVALFDLDRTLIDVNSATLWMRHEWAAGRLGPRDMAFGWWSLFKYSLGVGRIEAAFEYAVRLYEGMPETEMEAQVSSWFEASVRQRARPGALDAIARHRARGDALVVATTSSCYAARAAVGAWGFDDYVATTLEVRDGHFTGRVGTSALGAGKLTVAREWLDARGVDLARATFYTDSISDLPLLEAVGTPVAVNPDRRLRRVAVERGWAVVDWGSAPVT